MTKKINLKRRKKNEMKTNKRQMKSKTDLV